MLTKILLGSYTRRVSEGIYSIFLDTEKEQLTDLKLEVKGKSPTYLAKSQAGNVYTLTTVDGKGGVAAYDAAFNLLNTVTEEGSPVCYVSVDEARQLVYGANYHKGEVNVYKILPDGSLEMTEALYHDEPTGPHENQDIPHAHYADLTPDKRLAVCDLGTDIVYTYDVSDTGRLTEVAQYHAEPATGPRHLIFHPNGKYAYLFGELDSTITVLAYQAADGTFSELQKISTLPEDFHAFNGGAAVKISNDGKTLYASNRGHDSLAVFEIQDDGAKVALIQRISTEGKIPRDFSLDPTNNFLVAANQDSDNLTLYRRNPEDGKLTMIQKDVYAPECVCVYFD